MFTQHHQSRSIREVSRADLDAKAQEFEGIGFETSAKDGSGVKDVFDTMIERIPVYDAGQNLTLTSPRNPRFAHIVRS